MALALYPGISLLAFHRGIVGHPLAMVRDTVMRDITLQDLVVHTLAMAQDTVLEDITLQDMVAHPMAMAQGTVALTLVHITEKSEEMKTQDEESAWNPQLTWHRV